MHATLPLLSETNFPAIRRAGLATLQVNLGYRCNQSCLHCHVNAGPGRKEEMDCETVDAVLQFMRHAGVQQLDLTGGAPEMNSNFRYLVECATREGIRVTDRCNLTILMEPGFEDLAVFLADHRVEVVASLPCYLEENVDGQRGDGVFEKSLAALKQLNHLGYGRPDTGLVLNLMYNPVGPSLPPSQQQLEADYREALRARYGIGFSQLFVLANMPIQRFGSTLVSRGEFESYMELLRGAHRPENLSTVMCRSLVSIDWQGYVYDCDFNQMLGLVWQSGQGTRIHISDLAEEPIEGREIAIADHCFGCTAGQGSSCGGAIAGD
ncbi:radical SAM/Cys-rich protein [Thiogranum longum]|uniref:Radical SAM/Cys-rich protein n=1 Tax=Thiogranum longum TaxID=1537524 RepID=A0A4R1HF73_9GAMM|nr:arsenosugar biosynthesis radical SAM (seleno)protein ArsS [Thiogranum longum]TCK18985.1 radical SAM/Cys-rich protein [Thiogranum longum]